MESRGGGHLSLPTWDIGSVGPPLVLLQFEQAQDKVSEGGHGVCGIAARDLRGILAQGDIATVMGTVFTGSPVAANVLGQLPGSGLLSVEAGDMEAVLPGFINDFSIAQFLAIAPQGDELPASGESGLLRSD